MQKQNTNNTIQNRKPNKIIQDKTTTRNNLKHKIVSVKASAGTGKTYNLSARYIALLLCGAKTDEILCLTFTNASANDMRQKIAGFVANLGSDPEFIKTIQTHIDISTNDIIQKQPQIYHDFISSSNTIVTIDKFFSIILRQFAGYLDINDNYRIATTNKHKLGFEFLRTLLKPQLDSLLQICLKTSKNYESVLGLFEVLQNSSQDINFANTTLKDLLTARDDVITKASAIQQFVYDCASASASAKKAVEFDSFEDIFASTWIQKKSFKEFGYFKKIANNKAEQLFVN